MAKELGAETAHIRTAARPASAVRVKRAVDLVVASAMLAISSPLQLAVAALICLESGRPILFRQRRAGRAGSPFLLLKFRSMRVHPSGPEDLIQVRSDHPLLTHTGRIIRRLKIDELPQLLNVVKGDMSLVGPRPSLPEWSDEYTSYERRRLLVRPGLTGWAQVNGNVSLPWPERILLDVWYVDHWSLWLDIKILFKTVWVVLVGERPEPHALEEARAHAIRSGWGG